VSQLEEETSIVIASLMASKREEGSGDVGALFALARNFRPRTEETKKALVNEVTLAVGDTVPDSVRRGSDVQGGGGESRKRRRRAIEEDTDDDESGMSVSEVGSIYIYTRKNAQEVVTGLQTSCYKSVHKLSTSCVRTACSQLLQHVWNKLLITCSKLDGIIRLVTRLF
jgi:hypothetical protein